MAQHSSYRTVKVDSLSIFYREAGPKDAPVILLLHGLPSSSRMFEPLLTRLAGQFHMVAPDYPGFGHSDAPSAKEFSYTFDKIATLMDHFTAALNQADTSSTCRTMAVRSASGWPLPAGSVEP
jgi:pimeloyl-ACP methyl ester carboxylesterase